MSETLRKWARYLPQEERKPLEQIVATSKELGNVDGLCKGLRNLGEAALPDQVVIAFALKAKALMEPAIAERVWEIISDADWRQKVLGTVETKMLGLLLEGFIILQAEQGEKWSWLLPHYIADLCEKTDDEERRRLLFLLVIHASLVSDTISAVLRLLRGDSRVKFLDLTKEYRDRLEAMRSKYPPWVAGKLRGLIANLYIS